MFNTPDGLPRQLDPALDFDDEIFVECEQANCCNEIEINTDELVIELETCGGVTCGECLDE